MRHNIAANTNLLFSLIQKQEQSQLSDGKFATQLGIARTLWQATRAGDRNIGLTLLKAVARTYPDMHQDIIEFLKDSTGEK